MQTHQVHYLLTIIVYHFGQFNAKSIFILESFKSHKFQPILESFHEVKPLKISCHLLNCTRGIPTSDPLYLLPLHAISSVLSQAQHLKAVIIASVTPFIASGKCHSSSRIVLHLFIFISLRHLSFSTLQMSSKFSEAVKMMANDIQLLLNGTTATWGFQRKRPCHILHLEIVCYLFHLNDLGVNTDLCVRSCTGRDNGSVV